nr:unnamed protein product [Callosobruchus analis]
MCNSAYCITVDCTYIKIQSPGGNLAEIYRNRKGWFSINTRIVAGSIDKIIDIVARWPGSVHDPTIFNDSHLRARFEGHHFSQYCFVGDSGYPRRVYLLTPIVYPTTISQQRYNVIRISWSVLCFVSEVLTEFRSGKFPEQMYY